MIQLRERDFMSQLCGFVLNNQSLGRNQRQQVRHTRTSLFSGPFVESLDAPLTQSNKIWMAVAFNLGPPLSWCWFKVSASLRKKPLWMLVAPAAAAAFSPSKSNHVGRNKVAAFQRLSTCWKLLRPPPLPRQLNSKTISDLTLFCVFFSLSNAAIFFFL